MPMVVPPAGTKLPNDGLTITIGMTCSLVQEIPIVFPSVGTKLPKLGFTRTIGTTLSLGQTCVSCAQTRGALRPTTLITPIATPTKISNIRFLISISSSRHGLREVSLLHGILKLLV